MLFMPRRSRHRKAHQSVSEISASRIQHVYCAAGSLTTRAAGHIVGRERGHLPDLSHAVIVLPALNAAADIARALRHVADAAAVLLPRITTLAEWSASVMLDRSVATRPAREAVLYQALAERGWLQAGDLWAVARELTALFDDLTQHAVALPATVDEFARQLERAYRARRGEALQFEARLVHELWHLLARDTDALDPEAAYQLRLAALARNASAPLYVIGPGRLSRAEERFFEAYAARASACIFHERIADAEEGVAHALKLAWLPPDEACPDLPARAAALRAAQPASPLVGRVRYFGATSAELEAQAVDVTLREWLLAGKQRIAIVVNDRLTARRARALLERAEILVRDETGWAFSTTSAATAIGRWLDVASGDSYHRDLLDLLKSPFVFHDWARDARQSAVWRLERYVSDANVTAGLSRFIALAEAHNDAEVRQLLVRVQRGLAALGRGRRPLALWLDALMASLGEIGVCDGLAADQAGEQLLELLARLGDELGENRLAVDFAEWRRWLASELETATFSDRTIESPVVFVSLYGTRLRAFDAVLIIGADAAHLPGADPAHRFFNQGVRAQLGLPTRAEELGDIETALAGLIAASDTVMITWQRLVDGEPNLLSPHFERLEALHRLAYGAGLVDADMAARLPAAEVRCAAGRLPEPTAFPAPAAAAALLPEIISASGYNTLMACPYQFHARYLLGLAELDDVQELIEKKDYGQIVHGVLQGFHAAHPLVMDLDIHAACDVLERMSEAAFAGAVAQNYLARAWLERWRALIPGYVHWQRARETEGWRWQAGEAQREIIITTPQGARLRLHGRIDRIDEGQDGAVAVIDYKTQRKDLLRKKLEIPGEDVQLTVYTLLWGAPVATAAYLSIEREGVASVPVPHDVQKLAEDVRDRLCGLFDALRGGAQLPAHGIEAVCDYCEMRGLCRRNYWL